MLLMFGFAISIGPNDIFILVDNVHFLIYENELEINRYLYVIVIVTFYLNSSMNVIIYGGCIVLNFRKFCILESSRKQ